MKTRRIVFACAAFAFAFSFLGGPLAAQTPNHKHYEASEEAARPGPGGVLAPRLQRLGDHAFPVSCKGELVQEFFNQGINLSYGFNHAEAARAFAEVARRAPGCAPARRPRATGPL